MWRPQNSSGVFQLLFNELDAAVKNEFDGVKSTNCINSKLIIITRVLRHDARYQGSKREKPFVVGLL